MPVTDTLMAGLLLAALVPTFAHAQNGGNLSGTDRRMTPRAANTARSGRTLPPSRDAAPETTGSVNRGKAKGELGGLTTKGICIGCGAR